MNDHTFPLGSLSVWDGQSWGTEDISGSAGESSTRDLGPKYKGKSKLYTSFSFFSQNNIPIHKRDSSATKYENRDLSDLLPLGK